MAQTLNFTPIADAYLDWTNPVSREENSGGSIYLCCAPQYASLLRFTISSIPAGGTVQSVTLSIKKAGLAGNGTNYLRKMKTTNWTEYGATHALAVYDTVFWVSGTYNPYDNDTGFGTGFDYESTNLSTLNTLQSDPDGTIYTFPSTSAFVNLMQTYVNKTANLDLTLPFGAGVTFYSRTGATPPTLSVQYLLPPPTISSFTPLSTSAVGTTITVNGTNFGASSSLLDGIQLINQGQGGNYALTGKTWVGSQQVKGNVPADIQPGIYLIRVTIDGQSADSSETFAFIDPGPSISSISPAQIKTSKSFTLTINGSNFDSPVSEVALIGQANQGEKNLASFTRISSTQITASLPSGTPIGPYRVRIVSDGNMTLSQQILRIVLGPVVW